MKVEHMYLAQDNLQEELDLLTYKGYEEYLNPTLLSLFKIMGLDKVESHAEGNYIFDTDGKPYVDFLGGYGVFNLGHRHPKVVQAVIDQLHKMPLNSKVLLSSSGAKLATLLAELSPGDLKYSFFCNSGAEAVEGALKLAKLATKRSKIVSTIGGFHGKTLGALSATGRDSFRSPCEPLLPGFIHVPFGNIDAIKEVVDENTAAVILEPIQGEGGINLPPEGYLASVRELCDLHGCILIFDEVQTGMGRTGKLFACEHWEVQPDILCLAKALGGGVMPIGAVIGTEKAWQPLLDNPFIHTSTFGGNPLATTAAIAALKTLLEEGLIERADTIGKDFISELEELKAEFPRVIKSVRGKGLLLGIEFVMEGQGGLVMSHLFEGGILVAYTLNNTGVMRIEPPLTIGIEEINYFLKALRAACQEADKMFGEEVQDA